MIDPQEDRVFVAINGDGEPLAQTTLAYDAERALSLYRHMYGHASNPDIRIAEYRLVPMRVVEMPQAVSHD